MSDRAVDSHEGATVCPFVAFQDDRDRRATDPDHRHRCYAELQPAPRAIAHQRRYCLSPEFPSCPTFQDWAVRAAATGVSLPSARTVGLEAPPPAVAASVANGGSRRSFDWAAPPPWVAEASGTAGDRLAGNQLTAFDDGDDTDDADAGDEAAASLPPAAAAAASLPAASDETAGGAGYPGRASAAGTTERPRSGRGFAYDLIAQDPAFTPAPEPELDADDQDEDAEDAGPVGSTLPVPPTAAQAPMAGFERGHADLAPSRPQPAPPPPEAAPRASRVPPPALPPPEYLPPGRQMATPIGAAGRPGPSDGGREWERPRRFEAYPTLRTRVGLPGLSRASRLPPVVIGIVALGLAAGILFMLPGFFGGGGPNTAEPSRTPRPTVSVKPTTPPPPTPQTYTVKRGDTLSGIAKQFGVSIAELLAANPQITNANSLKIGQVINIPDPFAATPIPSDGTQPSASAEPS